MGKGLPGGRRQAGSIDYRIEPCSFVLPDRPQRVLLGRARPTRGPIQEAKAPACMLPTA